MLINLKSGLKSYLRGSNTRTEEAIFNDLIIELNKLRENQSLSPITKVIFIDDSKNNLESVQIAADKIGINFYGYHFHKRTATL